MTEHLADVVDLVDPTELPEADKRRAAEADAAADPTLTGAALARRYGKDARWGRHRIDKVRPRQAAPAPQAPTKVPPAVPGAAPAAPQVPPRRAPAPGRQVPPAVPEDRWHDRGLAAGRLVVLLVAAVLSYSHMRALGVQAGGDDWQAALWPLSVDGLLVVALLHLQRARRHGGGTLAPWTALVAALGASLAANIASAEPTVLGRCWAAWPPLALLAVEVLGGRRRRQAGA